MTTDMGVELGIGDVSGLSVEEILPTWSQDELQAESDDTADPASCLADTFMPKALVIPGLNHIVNNMSMDANQSMLHWEQWLAGFRPIVQVLHHSHLRSRLVASCIRGSPHAWMEKYFQSGPPMFATWRWGSVVSALKVMLPVGPHLRRCWDPQKFNRCQQEQLGEGGGGGDAAANVDADELTRAIRSSFFWSYGKMVLILNEMADRFASWAEGCACHPFSARKVHAESLLPDQRDREGELDMLNLIRRDCGLSGPGDGRQFGPCPLAGLRAFELASGEAQKQVQGFAALSHEQVLLELEHLSETATNDLLEDFELGRSSVTATLANKLQHWQVLPWSLVLLSDPDVDKGPAGGP